MLNYWRIRVIDPKECIPGTYRTKDVGDKGGIQIIIARVKNSGKYHTQAFRVQKYHKGTVVARSGNKLIPVPTDTKYARNIKKLLSRLRTLKYKGGSDFKVIKRK